MSDIEPISTAYLEWFRRLRAEIDDARKKAARAINAELLTLYWTIGNEITQRQAEFGWGARVIDLLAKDLRSAFPGMKGFSPRNLKYMRKFASEWSQQAIVQGNLAQLPWYHHVALMDKVADVKDRIWYGKQVVENGWTRDVLVHQIETKLIERHGRAITNFSVTIPDGDRVAIASDLFKDPYVLDFVDAGRIAHERHLENALIDRIKGFSSRIGEGVRIHRKPIPSRRRWTGLLPGPVVLSHQAAQLHRDRLENGRLRARVRG